MLLVKDKSHSDRFQIIRWLLLPSSSSCPSLIWDQFFNGNTMFHEREELLNPPGPSIVAKNKWVSLPS
jgi:hypothetical protein